MMKPWTMICVSSIRRAPYRPRRKSRTGSLAAYVVYYCLAGTRDGGDEWTP